jgi:hypothetical protein
MQFILRIHVLVLESHMSVLFCSQIVQQIAGNDSRSPVRCAYLL